jgi:hypothetical protein
VLVGTRVKDWSSAMESGHARGVALGGGERPRARGCVARRGAAARKRCGARRAGERPLARGRSARREVSGAL